MARPKKTPTPHIDAAETANHQALAEAAEAAKELGDQLRTIDLQYALAGPYNYDAIDLGMTTMRHIHESSALWMGRALILVREHEPKARYEEFRDSHLSERTARRYIQYALKVDRVPGLKRLGSGKGMELLYEDDDSLAEFVDGNGTVAGLHLDDIDRLTVRELKETLRKERADRADEKAADEDIIAGKDKRINKLLTDRRKAGRSPLREQADGILEQIDNACIGACSALAAMRDLSLDVEGLYQDAGEQAPPEIFERIDSNRQWAAARLREIAHDLGE